MSKDAFDTARLLRENISRVVLGKDDLVQMLVVSVLLASEHLLLEDVPGVGKDARCESLGDEYPWNVRETAVHL